MSPSDRPAAAHAAIVLGAVGDEGALPFLFEMLSTNDRRLRKAATRGLIELREFAIPVFARAFDDADDPLWNGRDPGLIGFVYKALEDPDERSVLAKAMRNQASHVQQAARAAADV